MRFKATHLLGILLCMAWSLGNPINAQPSKDTSTTMLQVIEANCNQPPIVICPPAFEACPGASTDPANTGQATGLAANAFCSAPMVSYSDSIVSTAGCNGSLVLIRKWTATDPQNNALQASCEQLITLSDTIAPLIIDCPTDIDAAPNGGCFANVFWQQPLVVDNCGQLDLNVTHVSGDRFPIGTTTVTYTATDECGNQSSCSFDITVAGDCCDLPPIIMCPGNYSGCPGDTILPKKIGKARAMPGRPNCDPPAIFYRDDTLSVGPCAGAVIIDRIWVAVDPHDPGLNAQCIQRIELNDVINPFIFGCPGSLEVDTDSNCIAVVNWVEPSARDNCEKVKMVSNFSPGDTFPIGVTTVIYVATDSCGNRATCQFDVKVNKACCTNPPVIVCPKDYFGCPGSSVDTSITGVPGVKAGSVHCDDPVVSYEETVVSEGPCPGARVLKRLWIAQDPNDPMLRSTCLQFITLSDTTNPTLVKCASNTTVSPNIDCRAVVSWVVPRFTDNCSSITLTSTHQPGDTFDIGNTTVTYTATDACGNESSCSFVVTVLDDCCNKPPTIVCPPDYTTCPKKDINPDITGRPTWTKGHPNCDDPIISYSDETVSNGPCPNQMTVERRWIATDPNDQSLADTCIQIIELKDEEAPIFWECPTDTTVSPDANCEAIVSWTPPLATDNCGLVSVTTTHEPGDTFQIGSTTVTYTAVDGCGNDTTCSFVVTVTDECCMMPPTITCPPDYAGCPGADLHPDFTGSATAKKSSDFCDDPLLSYTDDTTSTGPCQGAAIVERTWRAVIPNQPHLIAECVQILTLSDTEKPVLSNCPKDTSVAPNDNCEAIVSWARPGISDNCGIRSVISTHMPGDVFPLGTTTVTYTLTDVCDNVATCSFTITVRDECCNKPPVVTCPTNFNGCPGVSTLPSNTGMATATKGHPTCDDPVITYDDNIVSTGPCAGATVIQRSWIATDPNNGLADTCTQLITLEDDVLPTLANCPNDTTLSPNVDCEARVTWNNPDFSDNCGTPTLTGTHNSGDLFPIGTTTVTLTVTDACGNTATCSFNITVLDDCCNKPPVVTCPTNFNGCPGVSTLPANTGMATATKGHPTCDDPVITYDDNIVSTGPCAGATVIQRSWIATDPNNGMADTCTQLITLEDDVLPTLANCPNDTTLSPNVDCEARVTWNNPDFSDNCGTPTLTGTHNSGDLFPIGITTVTLTVTDACGNTATCSFNITVLDDCCNKPPVVTCPTNFNGCPGVSTLPANTGMATATKGHPTCDDPVITYDDNIVSTGPCAGATVIQRSWIATDPNNGMADTCTQLITLEDDVDPTLTNCPVDMAATADATCKAKVSWTPPTADDNCSVTLTSTHQPGDEFEIGTTTVTYTATDGCGNTTSCSFTVTVDGSNIHIMCPNDTVIVHPSFSFGEYVYWNEPKVTQCDPSCPDSIPGFIYMGERNGHRYFCSEFRSDWNNAQRICDSLGGYLAVVNDEAENAYLAGLLMGQPAYIGLNDWASEGNFEWVNGDPLNFTSWALGQPDNKNNYQHVVELYPDGSWEDQFYYVHNEFICEIPCYTVKQIEGPENGGFFTCGPTEVTYVAEDGNGDTDTCTFVVDVDCDTYKPYCYGRGINSDNYWLNSIKTDGLFKETGNDYGYGDYTAECIELTSGTSEQICLGIGYGGSVRNVYWKVWIDYNGDRDFSDQGETVASGFGNTVVCGDIQIPQNLSTRTFMRVAISYGRWPSACGFVSQGEYEDYCVIIDGKESLQRIITEESILEKPETIKAGERSLSLSPNPAQDILTILWNGELPESTEVVDMYGRRIYRTVETNQRSLEVSVGQWQAGRYTVISHYSDGQTKTKALIIME